MFNPNPNPPPAEYAQMARTLFRDPLESAHFPGSKNGVPFLGPRFERRSTVTRARFWNKQIQSYSLNYSPKEQDGSNSLHVRMYALVLAPCSNCRGLLRKSTFSAGFFGLVNEPTKPSKMWTTP